MLQICPVHRGRNTITSLINVGMDNSTSEWTLVVMAGAFLRNNLDRKYSYFVTSQKDILFPIVDGKTNFVDGTLNGIMVHRDTWKEIGQFSNQESLSWCKLSWAMAAIEHGCCFKAILGAQIC